jgi:NAD(P)-dependent dehydrogenase (short-subunit alcohol dehydrogenase family)
MTGEFLGKVVLVTGGSSGMGRAAALGFARRGARVVVAADKNVEGGNETVRLINEDGGEATFFKADISKAADVEALVNKSVELYGRLDYANNNAGISGSWQTVSECTEEDWDRVISINLKGAWLCMKYEILWMCKHGGGAIVNTASVAGLKATPVNVDYVASKHGVIGLTKSAALAYAKDGIRVNAVCPGIISTPMTDNTVGRDPEALDAIIKQAVPLARLGASEDIAEAVVWLCSDAASFVTGLIMPVDGGMLV